MLSFTEFKELSKQYNVISISEEVIVDLETPVGLYIKSGAYLKPYSFLLESVTGGDSRGRFSIIGLSYNSIVKGKNGSFTQINKDKSETALEKNDAIFALEEAFSKYKYYQDESVNSSFKAGAVGYFAYDIIRYYEKINIDNSFNEKGYSVSSNDDPLNLPDMVYSIPELLFSFDHALGSVQIVRNIFLDDLNNNISLEELYRQALEEIEIVKRDIHSDKHLKTFNELAVPEYKPTNHIDDHDLVSNWQANTSNEEYAKMVEAAREYMKAGDIFQVVLSKRYERDFEYNPFFLYRALRFTNPSPYMFYLNFPEGTLVGSSPEILVKKTDKEILVRPIAGTIKRGKSKIEDEELGKILLADKKEIAEHVMLVDLGRNDAGRISKYGSVKVDEFMIIEKYSHVMHIVSNVIGELKEEHDAFFCTLGNFTGRYC